MTMYEAVRGTDLSEESLAARPSCATAKSDPLYCPECGMPAWVEWRDTASSTDGPVEHVKIRCFSRHWFLLPTQHLQTDS
jgi:hypothetical protein